ncbi:hypothetical protein NQX30_07580 [Candidatus Persebacteraceae bacterium Df01]|jgi:GMP synthase-like glutamine amidotransferase|uniref:Glutamine amidotransferase domain-containing protein n=1 Tax=Candidatus Doriopsillibacter californiensis TaxID=2970740 RepID=A0ABT7QNK2_9GAMM|nr:hypothetical protein [Candidatus Persebacteraceae bacterium Df01]
MKIGILLADDLRDTLVPRFGGYSPMFQEMLHGNDYDWQVFDVRAGEYPATVGQCDGYFITGSRHGVGDNLPWVAPLLEFIRRLHNARQPLVGICFGHQAVAQALGGKVSPSNKGWGVGLHTWQIHADAPWMRPLPPTINLLCSHQDQIVTLPPIARRLAGSDFCPEALFCIDEHIFCTQGHPEFSADFLCALWDIKRAHEPDLLPPHLWQQIAESKIVANDNALFANWLAAFFSRSHVKNLRT